MKEINVTAAYLGDAFCSTYSDGKVQIEARLYAWASTNVDNYDGGVWETVTLPNGSVYRRLCGDQKVTVHNKASYWSEEVSLDMMGIIATCVAVNHTLWAIHEHDYRLANQLEKQFYALRNWALENHDEAIHLAAALD